MSDDIVKRLRAMEWENGWFERAADEIERLRAALERIADGSYNDAGLYDYTAAELRGIARAALAGGAASPASVAPAEPANSVDYWQRRGYVTGTGPCPVCANGVVAVRGGMSSCANCGYMGPPDRNAAPATVAPEWQPIETAPKQRKVIVHYLNPRGKHRVVMACYYAANSLEMHDDFDAVGTYDDETGVTWADEGWYEEHDSDNPILPLGGTPTHWMPLPSPPGAAVQPPAAPAPAAPCPADPHNGGDVCYLCGKRRAASGVDGGTWVHLP